AGLATVHADGSLIRAVETTAAERVELITPVVVRDGMPVHEWLDALQNAIRTTLAHMLPGVLAALESLVYDVPSVTSWLESAPTQLLVLA
ncbi:hypothetical protein NL463_28230, partial [Klebsiella pneumoniae]|nr:hypothetical protein [Klebsiella pneumoniae]